MQERINSNVRRSAGWALLPAVAIAGLLASLPAAQASDQQATGAEMDYAISQQQAARGGSGFNAYAQAPQVRGHRSAHRTVR